MTVTIPKGSSVFLLEDSDERIKWFKEQLPEIVIAKDVEMAIKIFSVRSFDFVFLDHDLSFLDYAGVPVSGTSGHEMARYLSGRGYLGKNVFIHSWNPVGAAAMKDLLEGAFAVPYGQFKIVCI